MRLRKRHAYSAVLIALFALPVLQPDGLPAVEDRVDSILAWTARSELANPHAWRASDPSDESVGDGPRVRALEQMLLAEREEHARVLDELAQRGQLADTRQGFERLPIALSARILRAHDAAATRRSLLLDRGTADGVEVGQAVAQGRVLVGVVQHVDAHTARVQLLTDPYARLAVAVRTRDGVRATAWLRGGVDDEMPLRNLRASDDLHVEVGDPVLTSHDDGVVPAGLVVGYVTRASDDDGDGVLDVRVHPLLDLGRSTTVLVLLPAS